MIWTSTYWCDHCRLELWKHISHYAGGPRRPPPPQLHLRRSRDLAHASIPLAQSPWGLTGRAWQAGAQQAVIAVDPSFKSLGIDSRNELNLNQNTRLTIEENLKMLSANWRPFCLGLKVLKCVENVFIWHYFVWKCTIRVYCEVLCWYMYNENKP